MLNVILVHLYNKTVNKIFWCLDCKINIVKNAWKNQEFYMQNHYWYDMREMHVDLIAFYSKNLLKLFYPKSCFQMKKNVKSKCQCKSINLLTPFRMKNLPIFLMISS